MKLVIIPPYLNPRVQVGFLLSEIVDILESKGQLEGVEVDIDEGYFIDSPSERRDEEVVALISVGFIKKAKEYSEMGKHDAIISSGGVDPGFVASRVVSEIPVLGAVHSTIHVASLIGERFSVIHPVAQTSLIVKHLLERYGFDHKLASVRFIGHWSTHLYEFIRKYEREERGKVPEGKKIIDDITTQCITAIEKDRADTLIFACEPLEILEVEARQRLDEAGYSEIPIVCDISASVEMAKAMVNMKLVKAPRAYPSASLKAKPEHW